MWSMRNSSEQILSNVFININSATLHQMENNMNIDQTGIVTNTIYLLLKMWAQRQQE